MDEAGGVPENIRDLAKSRSYAMSAVLAKKFHTPEEYLAAERAAEHKSEYVDGDIVAMAGAKREHVLIAFNIGRSLGNQLADRPCEVYLSDMRVKAALARNYRYPDIAVVCGAAEFEDAQTDTLLNPTVLIEVLSPNTEASDRGEKFAEYRGIPSLREYLLVAQDRPRIEHYARQDHGWLLTVAEGLESCMALEAIGCALELREVYRRVLDGDDQPASPGI